SFISGVILVYFDSFFLELLARLLAGITAAMWVMATVIYSYYFTADKSSKAMGTMYFNTVKNQYICMALSGYIIHLYEWYLSFWIAIVASLLGIVFVLKIKDVPDEKPKSRSMSIKDYISKTHAISGIKTITFLSLVAHAILFITIFGF